MTKEQIKALIQTALSEMIPFNKVIGIRIVAFDDPAQIEFDMQDHLIGNSVSGILHGGVTASALDFVGGMAAMSNVVSRTEKPETLRDQLARMGTIDLRVDYIRGARGKKFVCIASVLRTGNKVAVTRMEMHNDKGVLVAAGTGTYIVG